MVVAHEDLTDCWFGASGRRADDDGDVKSKEGSTGRSAL